MAKAFTANGFSNSQLAISTANLYAPTQPGGSLYGLNNSNPFNPAFDPQHTGLNQVAGGIITFGGGVALYKGRPGDWRIGRERRYLVRRPCHRMENAPKRRTATQLLFAPFFCFFGFEGFAMRERA